MRASGRDVTVKEQFIGEALGVLGVAPRQDVFQFHQASEMHLQGGVAPTGESPQIPPPPLSATLFLLHLLNEPKKPPGLRRHVLQSAAEDFMGESVGAGDVIDTCRRCIRGPPQSSARAGAGRGRRAYR